MNKKNDALIGSLSAFNNLSVQQLLQYKQRNIDALEAFKQRKIGKAKLSSHVWNITEQFKSELELALSLGIGEGRSADQLSRDIRHLLNNPDKLFRRVRNKFGELALSKNAKAYHPSSGVYRSSYKNARRLAATETNIAYRTADYERMQQADYIVGIRVQLSNNHTLNGKAFTDICDQLSASHDSKEIKGRGCYPKNFKFTGWHPLCRCFVTTILKSEKELAEDFQRMLRGEKPSSDSENSEKGYPKEFTQWLADHREQIAKAQEHGTLPYFIKDNKEAVDGILGQITKQRQMEVEADFKTLRDSWFNNYLPRKINISSIEGDINNGDYDKAQKRIDLLLSSAERHKARTADDIRRIQDLWDERIYGKAYVENVHMIEQTLGVQRGKRMTHEQANMGKVNPNYGKRGYNSNGSTCSATYILRSMGFDVQAKANIAGNTNVQALSRGKTTWDKWENGATQYNSTKLWMENKGYKRMNSQRYMEFIEENTQTAGIYEFNVGYKGGGGHSTLLRRNKDGSIERIEQQNTNNGSLADLLSLLEATPLTLRGIYRVDNAKFNAKYADIVELVK